MRIFITLLLWITTLLLPQKKYLTGAEFHCWNFNTLKHWQDDSQQTDGKKNYELTKNGYLKIFTHPKTVERSKIKSAHAYTTGTYTWKIFIPKIGKGDNTSIGAFLYSDDTRELDFEIGYGTKAVRTSMDAQNDELIVLMTSQGYPNCSKKVKIKRNTWYEFSLTLKTGIKNEWITLWKINQKTQFKTVLHYPKKTYFHIYCSAENLSFMGDHLPNAMNYALFDYVKFETKQE